MDREDAWALYVELAKLKLMTRRLERRLPPQPGDSRKEQKD